MGTRSVRSAPHQNEFEVTLFGPGYGESLVLHIGGGCWVIIDSCIDKEGNPRALKYLDSINVDPAQAVKQIVATHWHDDHIRGMNELVEVCCNASFCCALALCKQEFLAAIDALEGRHLSVNGSRVQELHRIFTQLESRASQPTFALANRRIFIKNKCEIWSLSPDDSAIRKFLQSVGTLFPGVGQVKNRIPSIYPNEAAVALWVEVDDVGILLGSDLEKKG